jgi:serine protease Do
MALERQCLPVSFSELAAAADPAVVQVRTKQNRPSKSGRRQITGEGLGSGFVYDAAGRLLTNYHVVANASEILVTLKDGRELSARVIGADPPTDLAILQVDGTRLPALELGSSEKLRVGDWVVAIGNPFGLSHTVSAGIVSAKERTMSDLDNVESNAGYIDFLQTDASINPGNSGGPLIDMDGKVVGISTAIRAHSNNIGFAIPIDMVSELLPALVSHGKIRRSALGVTVDPVSMLDMKRLHVATMIGAVVRTVQSGSPAERAGIRVDDVLVEFDGRPLTKPERLQWLASMAGVGHVARIKVIRGSKTVEIRAALTELRESSEDEADPEQD